MEDLRKARIEHNLDRWMKVYLAPKVLVVDEFGIWPYDRESATAFFTLVSARYGIPKELISSAPFRCLAGQEGSQRPQRAKAESKNLTGSRSRTPFHPRPNFKSAYRNAANATRPEVNGPSVNNTTATSEKSNDKRRKRLANARIAPSRQSQAGLN